VKSRSSGRSSRHPDRPAHRRLCFLPGYSPELNPDEWVWKHIKRDRIGRAGVSGPDDLKAKALAALHRLQKLPHLVRGFFRDPSLHYITA
jgi:transposase